MGNKLDVQVYQSDSSTERIPLRSLAGMFAAIASWICSATSWFWVSLLSCVTLTLPKEFVSCLSMMTVS